MQPQPGLSLVLGLACLATPSLAQLPADTPAPDSFGAAKWLNWIGDDPSLALFEGRAVLLHYFTTEKPKSAQFLTLIKFWESYHDKGLVILAVSPDSEELVEEVMQTFPLPFPVAAGFDGRPWRIEGEHAQILIDRESTVFFSVAAANGIWNGKLLKGMKGTKRLGDSAHLCYRPRAAVTKKFKRVCASLESGELGKALEYLERLSGLKEPDAATAVELHGEIEDHVDRLMDQIRATVKAGEPALALIALKALAKDLREHAMGEAPAALLAELEEDEDVQRELGANKEYQGLVADFFRRGWEKNEKRFSAFAKEFSGTRAAEKMQSFWIPRAW